MSELTLRALRSAEIEDLISLGRQMHDEGAFSSVTFCERKVRDIFTRCTEREDFWCLVVTDSEKLVGFFTAVISADWFSEDRTAKELAIYVAPEYRGRKLAPRMIEAFLEWAEGQKAVTAYIGSSSDIDNDRVRKMFESAGFHGVGYNFKRKV